jgi:oxygen-independent coproporphyrinogen-3 oxidase
MCQFEVSKEAVGIGYLIDFDSYFAAELSELEELERAGLLRLHDEWISVTPKGRMLIRSICMVFDRYLRQDRETQRYSKTI